ncbi:hypothetical protein [Bradyrhizobium sp. USDA 4454]
MKRPGIIARQHAAQLNAETYDVDDNVREARAAALLDLDRRRRLSSAEHAVAEAEDRLRYARRDFTAQEMALADARARLRSVQDEMTD